MTSNRLLITGANGFLAQTVIAQVHGEWDVVALVREGSTPLLEVSVYYDSVDQLIRSIDEVSIVMHLAACIPTSQNANPTDLWAVNVDMVRKLTSAYPNARHVLASSISIYGVPESLPISIDTLPNKVSQYGLSKREAENIVMKVPKYAVIRFSSLVGIGMKGGTFIPSIVNAARLGEIKLFGSGARLQNYLDVEDAAAMCLLAARREDSFVSLGVGERSFSNNEVADMLVELTGASIIRVGADVSPSYVYEASESLAVAGNRIPLSETLKKMVG